MPDPIEDLEGFTMPTVTPLPAADVRRRGDRIRRRNNTLAAVGGIAAVAVIAAPFAIFAGGQGSSDDIDPAPPGRSWTTTVPDSFDIAALPAGATYSFEVVNGPTVDDVSLCGATAFSTATATDTAGATWSEPESSGASDRTLAVYADGATAQTALAGFRQAVLDCGRDGRAVNDVVDRTVPGAEDAFLYTNQIKDGALLYDMTAYEVVRVGNALYVANSHTSVGGEQAMSTVDLLVEHSGPVVDQMCAFSAVGCGDNGEAVDPVTDESAVQEIPTDFPLSDQMPEGTRERDGYEQQAVDVCENQSWTAEDTTDARQAAYTGETAGGWDRTIGVYATEGEASLALMSTAADVQACALDSEDGKRWVTVTPSGLGDSSVVYASHMGNGSGAFVVQLVQVGNAVLQDTTYVPSAGSVQETAALLAEQSAGVVDAMCLFTDEGC